MAAVNRRLALNTRLRELLRKLGERREIQPPPRFSLQIRHRLHLAMHPLPLIRRTRNVVEDWAL